MIVVIGFKNKIMKKLKHIYRLLPGVAFVCLAGLSSCTDLEIQETDSEFIEQMNDGTVSGDPAQLLEAALNDLSFYQGQDNQYSLFQHSSDEMIPPTRGVDWGDNGVWRTLHAHTWDATHEQVLNAWNTLNSRLLRTEEILLTSPTPEQAAQARFLQGFYMWHVLDLYGKVPFRDLNAGFDVLPEIISRPDAIDRAINLIEQSIENLPSAGPGQNTQPTKAAAYAMLTRMYLNRAVYQQPLESAAGPFSHSTEDLENVVRYADLLEEEGYEFEDDYFSIWSTEEDSERILVASQTTGQNRWMMTLHYSQNPSGWNGFTTISELYDSFEDDDPRLGLAATPDSSEFSGIGTGFLRGQQVDDNGELVIDERTSQPLQFTDDVILNGANTNQGIRVIKYHPARSNGYVILRYSMAMLNKAEAMLRMGNNDDALAVINEMREARGGDELDDIDDNSMLEERARETYWEGVRRVDQVRFGTFTDEWTEKPASDPSRVIFPIPQQALDSNPNLEQNPGY